MIVIAVLWIFVAVGIGLYARKQRFKFWTYFLISMFFTPLVAVIVFAVESHQVSQPQPRKPSPKPPSAQ
jgi:hypothetical protein